MTEATFDPAAYKRTTREQWQAAAEPWYRWAPKLEEWLGEATELMLDMAHVGGGSRVLDVAAGAGGQTIAAARRVGPEGSVLATDISENILEFAEHAAAEAGLANVTTKVMDGEALAVDEGFFDAVISRVGFIYFPDQHAAFEGMRRALKPGGRLAGVVYSTPRRTASSRSRSRSSAGAPRFLRRSRASRDRSASARPERSRRRTRRPGSRTSRCGG